MGWQLSRFALTKQVPLTISRGTTAKVEHLLLEFSYGGCTGRGPDRLRRRRRGLGRAAGRAPDLDAARRDGGPRRGGLDP